MSADVYGMTVYLVYTALAVALTVWLARTLFESGGLFLESVFEDQADLAEAVNRLLVTGFYMLNLGYALWLIRSEAHATAFAAVQFLVNRFAVLLLTLGAIHFVNVYVFWRIRRGGEERRTLPLAPRAVLVDGTDA